MASAGLIKEKEKAEKQLLEKQRCKQEARHWALLKWKLIKQINTVKNTKAHLDLNLPKESDPNQISKVDWLRQLSSEVEKSHKSPEMEYKEWGQLAHPVCWHWIIS